MPYIFCPHLFTGAPSSFLATFAIKKFYPVLLSEVGNVLKKTSANYVLDGNGSPVCTIGSISSFHTLLLQLPGKDQAPEPPHVIMKATHHMCMEPLG